MSVFSAVGDLGDIIAFLPTIRQLGGGHLILGNRNGRGAREPMTQARYDVIAPLIAVQPYITGMHREDDAKDVNYNVTDFRTKPTQVGYNLATWQADFLGITNLDLSPWLFAHPAPESAGRAVFARSLRYQNPAFDWRGMVAKYPGAIFVGLLDEHAAFCSAFGQVEYRPTANLLEVAELIAGSEIFCGNQSAPAWVAMGLGHSLIQEMDQWESNRNSIVARPNAEFRTC